MNIIETQIKIGRELVELNTKAMRKLAELTGEEQKRLLDLSRKFGERLQEIRDVTTFVELQREYAGQLWSGAEQAMKTRGEIFRTTAENVGETFRGVFNQDEVPAESTTGAETATANGRESSSEKKAASQKSSRKAPRETSGKAA